DLFPGIHMFISLLQANSTKDGKVQFQNIRDGYHVWPALHGMNPACPFKVHIALTERTTTMPKQWGDLSKEEKEKFEERDIRGDDGGDTGNSAYIDDGADAEKGD